MTFFLWDAYLLHCSFTRPPKEKYAICVCNKTPLLFFINSEARTRYDITSQLAVTPDDMPFLRHDSYINAAEVITCVIPTTCTIKKTFGHVPPHIKQAIIALVSNSKTLPKRFIDIILGG